MEDSHVFQDILATCDAAFLCSEFKKRTSFGATLDQSAFKLSSTWKEKIGH
jgi:hypothetical protein